MCYYCHRLGNNPSARAHRSENCRDPKNNHSKISLCHYCHVLNENPEASRHATADCKNHPSRRLSDSSEQPRQQNTTYMNHQGLSTANSCSVCRRYIDMATFCRQCRGNPPKTLMYNHCFNCHRTANC